MWPFKKKEKVPACKHKWELCDYHTHYVDNGCDVEAREKYVLFCEDCKNKKMVDEFDFKQMIRLGLIINVEK